MPLIRVEMFAGRDKDQKRAMVKEVTEAFIRTCGGSPGSVTIIIDETTPDNWGVAGDLVSD